MLTDCKIIAADIDGTLLDSRSRLTDATVNAVKAAIKRGVKFVLSTGRPYQGIGKYIDALGLENMPYILYNGAMVMIGGKTVYSLTIDKSAALTVVDAGHARKSTMICWANNELYCEELSEKIDFYKSISGVEPIIVRSLADVAELGITKFVWYDDPVSTARYHEEMKSLVGDKLNVHPSRVDFLEFVNKNCSKAVALHIVLDAFGIKREQSVAIGDGFNDLPMLEYAGLGVAMGNADARVKERCGLVTDDCDHDGLARFIENNIL